MMTSSTRPEFARRNPPTADSNEVTHRVKPQKTQSEVRRGGQVASEHGTPELSRHASVPGTSVNADKTGILRQQQTRQSLSRPRPSKQHEYSVSTSAEAYGRESEIMLTRLASKGYAFDEHSTPSYSTKDSTAYDTLDGTTLIRNSTSAFGQLPHSGGTTSRRKADSDHTQESAPAHASSSRKSQISRNDDSVQNTRSSLGSFSAIEQERLVMNDLLYVLMGIDGNYITRACYSHDNTASELDLDSIKYDLDPTMDPSIAELVGRILPLPKYLQLIEEFIETHSKFKYGRAQHALAATMRDLMKNYLLLIVQLETQAMSAPHFGLQKLWFYLHPSLNTMAALYSLIDAVNTAERKAESTHAIAESMGPEFPAGTHQEQAASISQSRGFTRGGGLVLSVLCERLLSFSGDPVLKALYAQLLSSSAVPYNAMLSTWIHSGEIFDPYDEFMVVETRGLNKDQFAGAYNDVYWEHRYTLRREYVPSFLAILQDKVLLAGKYLNVVRECGVQIPEPHIRYVDYRVNNQTLQQAAMSDVLVAMGGERFVEDIETAYGYANRTLLALLFKDYHLMERLRSLKHYFLLDQSDFLVHFLDVAHEHLLKPARDVGVEQVKSLLELILRDPAASPGTNTYKEDIEAELSSKHFVPYLMRTLQRRRELGGQPPGQNVNDVEFCDQDSSSNQILNPSPETTLDGIEAFQLRYTAPFPTSLIINQKVLLKYQLTFRHLFQCKYIERQLADAWRDQAKSGLYNRSRRFLPKKTSHLFPEQSKNDEHAAQEEKESIFMSRICALRTKMLHFMQQYMYHVGYEVVEQLWEKFEEELLKADTIEHVIQIHYEFQDRCMKECMLSNVDMVKAFRKLMLTCTDFCRFSNSYTRFKSPYTSANDNATRGSVPASLGHSSHPSALPEQVSDEYIAASGGAILTTEQAARKLKDLETSFLRQMRVLIDILKYYGATEAALFASLAARLDYNHFYARLPPDLSIVVRAPVDPTTQY